MRQAPFVAMLAGSIGLAWPPSAQAWGVEAHRAIALIAQQRLKPSATAELKALLRGKLDLASVAVCPDDIRDYWNDQKDGRPASLPAQCAAHFPNPPRETQRWHFVDIDAGLPTPTDAQIAAACGKGRNAANCVVRQIPIQAAILGDAAEPRDERARAAVFLIHLVADSHQPLHCAERDRDNGGGRVTVRLGRGREQSLHGLWDSAIPRRIGATGPVIASRLGGEIALAARERPEGVEAWALEWARESHAAARSVAYAGIPRSRSRRAVELDEGYLTAAQDLAGTRIALAGVRLAAVLNQALTRGREEDP